MKPEAERLGPGGHAQCQISAMLGTGDAMHANASGRSQTCKGLVPARARPPRRAQPALPYSSAQWASILDDGASENFAAVQVVTGLVDVFELVTPRNQFLERKFPFFVPTQQHREVGVGVRRPEAAPVAPLTVEYQFGVYRYLYRR